MKPELAVIVPCLQKHILALERTGFLPVRRNLYYTNLEKNIGLEALFHKRMVL